MPPFQGQTGHDPLEGVNAHGVIVTGARQSRIAAAFRPVLEAAVEHVARLDRGHSLYVYGSVATGTARVGKSDVDLVTIGLDAPNAHRLGSALTSAFPGLCRSVEVGPAVLSEYAGASDEAYGNRVFLRHYCVLLAGPAVHSGLPDFPADRAAARGFNGDIGERAMQWRTQLPDADPALLARRIARKTLFAVAGLVSVHDATWTTDRVAAAHRWGVARPGLAAALDTLVAWGDAWGDAWGEGWPASASKLAVQRALDGVVADVVAEFQAVIGLWDPSHPHQTPDRRDAEDKPG